MFFVSSFTKLTTILEIKAEGEKTRWAAVIVVTDALFPQMNYFLFWREDESHTAGAVIKTLKQGFPCTMGPVSAPTLPLKLLTPISRP